MHRGSGYLKAGPDDWHDDHAYALDGRTTNYQEATRAFWRQTVLPLATRISSALSQWLAAPHGLTLKFDLDQVDALTPERLICPPRGAQRSAFNIPTPMPHLGHPFEIKSILPDGTFEGYASLFDREDLGRDVILPGAFTESLARRKAAGIKLLYQHDPAEPIGVWDALREDAKGLYARGRLLLSVSRAREVHALLEAGALDGLSIGFKAVSARRDTKSSVRRISKIDLWEISIVTFPMLPDARIASVGKRLAAPYARSAREFERWLTTEGRFTQIEARALLGHGLRGLHALDAANGTTRLSSAIRAATRAMQS